MVDSTGVGAGRRLSTLLQLAWPIVLARATQSVIGFSDALFVAPLGEVPLAATTTGALNAFAAIILPMGTVFIVQSFVAQLRGRGELEGIQRFGFYGLYVAGLAGAFSALAIPVVPYLLSRFGYAPEVERQMALYLCIRLLSVAPAVGMEALGNWYGGLGNTRPAMIAGVVAMVVNILGCWGLIAPHFGTPGFGVRGAAWASVLGSWTGFVVILVSFVRSVRKLPASAQAFSRTDDRARVSARKKEFLRVLRFGLPNGFNYFLEFAAFALFINAVIGHLGTTVLAAFNVVMQLNSIGFMPAFGLASGSAILVGEAIGRKVPGEVWPIVRMAAIVSGAWMGSLGLVYTVAPRALMNWFRPSGPSAEAMVTIGSTMLMFAAVWQLFDALAMTFAEALRAAGDTAWCLVARWALAWVAFIPAASAAVFVFHRGVLTVMSSLVAYLVCLAVVLSARFASGRWRAISILEPSLVDP
jgi:MATE family multidrug resistance protein